MPETHWSIWIDTGGTFTDCLALDPAGDMHRAKVLSSGALRPLISRTFPLERYLDAFATISEGRAVGKILIST